MTRSRSLVDNARGRERRWGVLVGSLLFAVVAGGAIVVGTSEPVLYLLVLAQFLVCAVPIALDLNAHRFDPFEIIHPINLSYLLFFGAKIVYVLSNPFGYSREERIPINFDTAERAMVYVLIGMIAMCIGYRSRLAAKLVRRVPRVAIESSPQRLALGIVVMYVLGTGVRLVMYENGWYMAHESTGISVEQVPLDPTFLYFSYLCIFAYALAAFTYFQTGRRVFLVLWLLTIPGEVLYLFLTGSKFLAVVYLAVPPFAVRHFRGRLRLRHVLVPAFIFLFIVFPVVSTYRGVVGRGDIQWDSFGSDVGRAVTSVATELRTDDTTSYFGFSINEMMERAAGMEALTNLIVAIPEFGGFANGDTLAGIFNALIPTPLRPERDAERLRLLPEMLSTGPVKGGLSITQVGELYWNFGVPGIVIGSLVLGVFYRLMYLFFVRQREPLVALLYVLAWWNLVLVERWFWAVIPQMIKMVAIAWVAAMLMKRGAPARRTAPVPQA